MHRVQDFLGALGSTLRPTATPADVCPTCGGSKTVYAPTGRILHGIDGQQMPDYAVQPCPDCQPPVCETCGGLGVVGIANAPIGHPMFGKLIPCPAEHCPARAAQEVERHQTLVNYARLPKEHKQHTFTSFMALSEAQRDGKMAAYYAALAWTKAAGADHYVNRAEIGAKFGSPEADDWRNWLILYGEPGRGKSGLGAAIVNDMVMASHPVMYARLQNLLEVVQRHYTPGDHGDEFGSDSAGQILDRVREAPALVIDEFLVPNVTKDKADKVQAVINDRYDAKRPTVLMTNLDKVGMKAVWGDLIASRLEHCAHWAPVRGLSLRAEANEFDWE